MIKKIDFICTPRSQYEVLHYFREKLIEAIVKKGIICRTMTERRVFDALEENVPDLTIAFNGIPINEKGVFLCDFLNVPHLAILVDPPFWFLPLIKSSRIILSCDDQSGCAFLQSKGFYNHLFLPHAVEKELYCPASAERTYEVVMLATFIDFEERRALWEIKYPPIIRKAMEESVELVFSNQEVSFIAAFDSIYRLRCRKSLIVDPSPILFAEIYTELELYLKGRDRAELVEAIHDTPVHLFGGSVSKKTWKDYFSSNSNVVVHDSVNFTDALEIMKRTKILLNSNIKNKYGAHERLFSGLSSGALVLTNENPYLKTYFQDEDSIAFYQNNKKNLINDYVMAYLSNEIKRQQIVEKGQQIVQKNHTWDHRTAFLLEELAKMISKSSP